MNKQILRIREMEDILEQCNEAFEVLSQAMDEYNSLQQQYNKLIRYYHSASRKEDILAYENGELPEGLNCGVLSEDAIYDLIFENQNIQEYMRELCRQDDE